MSSLTACIVMSMDASSPSTASTQKVAAQRENTLLNPKHICSRPGCGNTANMACPTCIKLALPPSRFCGQECFRSNWDVHKTLHIPIVDPSTLPPEFSFYNFSGSLRPYQKTPKSLHGHKGGLRTKLHVSKHPYTFE